MGEVQRLIGGVGVSFVGQIHYDDGHKVEACSETEVFHMECILKRLISSVNVSKVEVKVQDVPAARKFESKERHTNVTPKDLSECWSIGLGKRERLSSAQHNK